MLLSEFRSLIIPFPGKKGSVLIGAGIPGSGKSTTIRGLLAGLPHTIINPDLIREELLGSCENHDAEKYVWKVVDERYEEAFGQYRYIAFDATNTSLKRRRPYIMKALNQGYLVNLLFFPMEVERAIYHQSLRTRRVPGWVIEDKARKMQMASDYEIEHCKIYVVRWNLE